MTGWAVFDLNGTLLDPAAIGPGALEATVLAAMTLNQVGEYRPFAEVMREQVVVLRGPGAADAAMEAAAAMPAFPEAAEALDLLAGAGIALAVLSNSATATAEAGLRRAGLRERFAHVIGTDQVGAFKPDGRVYRHGLAVVGARPEEAVMVAAHWWDLRGARAAGMRVAWVGHGEGRLSGLLPGPDAAGPGLRATAEAIVALGEGR